MSKFIVAFAFLVVSFGCLAGQSDGLRQERANESARVNRMQSDMLMFMLDHKLASAAVIATGGGFGAFLKDNMDPDARSVFIAAGALGLVYCVSGWDNFKECAETASELGQYADAINKHNDILGRIESRLAELGAGQ